MDDIAYLQFDPRSMEERYVLIYLKSVPSGPIKARIAGSHEEAMDIFDKCRKLWVAWGNGDKDWGRFFNGYSEC